MSKNKQVDFAPTMTKHPEVLLELLDFSFFERIQNWTHEEKGSITLTTESGRTITLSATLGGLKVVVDKGHPQSFGGVL
jgi:hypothetical protein